MSSSETMKVTIRDRASEAPWGFGLTNPCVRTVEISAFCPVDGERRGTPGKMREHDDGVSYSVDVWNNPCGHLDSYRDVAKEAAALAAKAAEAGQ